VAYGILIYGKKYINYSRRSFDDFIKEELKSEKYCSVNEVIRSRLRLLEIEK